MSSVKSRPYVVDASVAFGWFAEVAHSDRSVALLEAEAPLLLLAPDLVLVDLLNAGWKALRQGAITEAQFLAIGELALLPLEQLVIHLKQSHADVLCQPCGKR